jgi:carboxymethylenebutenolidase
MRTQSIGTSFLALPDGAGPHPGVIVIHELFGLNENMRDICSRFAEQGYAALAVDLFAGRNRAVCMARMFSGWLLGDLNYFGVPALKVALDQLTQLPEVDSDRIGAIGFCMGGTYAITWACTDNRLTAIAPFYGSAPRRKEALRRLCPVVGSWPEKDYTSAAAPTLETELTAAGIPHDLKIYPGAGHSFFNDRGANYHPAAAADAWQRVLAFFGEHISGQRPPQGSQ